MWPISAYRHAPPPPQSDTTGTSRTALHYTRDVTFQEDQSRIRHNPGVFARLRTFAYNVLRRNQTSHVQSGPIRRRSRRGSMHCPSGASVESVETPGPAAASTPL